VIAYRYLLQDVLPVFLRNTKVLRIAQLVARIDPEFDDPVASNPRHIQRILIPRIRHRDLELRQLRKRDVAERFVVFGGSTDARQHQGSALDEAGVKLTALGLDGTEEARETTVVARGDSPKMGHRFSIPELVDTAA
jgi:hypothetical protein